MTLNSVYTKNRTPPSALLTTAIQSGLIALVTGLLAVFTLDTDSFKLPHLENPQFWLSIFYLIFLCTIVLLYVQIKLHPKVLPTQFHYSWVMSPYLAPSLLVFSYMKPYLGSLGLVAS